MLPIKKISLVLSLLLCFSATMVGQKTSKHFCEQINNLVVQPLAPKNINRNEMDDSECDFEFRIDKETVISISVEKYASENESHNSIKKGLFLYAFGLGFDSEEELPLQRFNAVADWDELYFYKSKVNNFILLRKGKFVITIFAPKNELIIQMEKTLHSIEFN